jgi:hypothetical protein
MKFVIIITDTVINLEVTFFNVWGNRVTTHFFFGIYKQRNLSRTILSTANNESENTYKLIVRTAIMIIILIKKRIHLL